MLAGETLKFKRLQCRFQLEENGKLLLRDDNEGKLFQSDSEGPDGQYYVVLEKGQLRIYRGTPDNPESVVWESREPKVKGPAKLAITATKRLIVFREDDGGKREVVWMSPGQD